jgi:hypothetical protein
MMSRILSYLCSLSIISSLIVNPIFAVGFTDRNSAVTPEPTPIFKSQALAAGLVSAWLPLSRSARIQILCTLGFGILQMAITRDQKDPVARVLRAVIANQSKEDRLNRFRSGFLGLNNHQDRIRLWQAMFWVGHTEAIRSLMQDIFLYDTKPGGALMAEILRTIYRDETKQSLTVFADALSRLPPNIISNIRDAIGAAYDPELFDVCYVALLESHLHNARHFEESFLKRQKRMREIYSRFSDFYDKPQKENWVDWKFLSRFLARVSAAAIRVEIADRIPGATFRPAEELYVEAHTLLEQMDSVLKQLKFINPAAKFNPIEGVFGLRHQLIVLEDTVALIELFPGMEHDVVRLRATVEEIHDEIARLRDQELKRIMPGSDDGDLSGLTAMVPFALAPMPPDFGLLNFVVFLAVGTALLRPLWTPLPTRLWQLLRPWILHAEQKVIRTPNYVGPDRRSHDRNSTGSLSPEVRPTVEPIPPTAEPQPASVTWDGKNERRKHPRNSTSFSIPRQLLSAA